MKIYLNIILACLISIFLYACANPKVLDIKLNGDEDLNCKELKVEYVETRRFKEEALTERKAEGAQATRVILFWPAMLMSLHNIDTAIKAANDRGFHIVDIMRKKKCEEADKLFADLTKTSTKEISTEIKNLNKLYEKGVINKEEFNQAKKKF